MGVAQRLGVVVRVDVPTLVRIGRQWPDLKSTREAADSDVHYRVASCKVHAPRAIWMNCVKARLQKCASKDRRASLRIHMEARFAANRQ
jgi:hypothetical protein